MLELLSMEIVASALTFAQTWLIVILLGCITMRAFYLLWLHPLANVPGPKLAALTDLWKALAAHKGTFSTALREQHAKHGDAVRIGPNEVSVISPEDVKDMYGHKTEFLKGPYHDAFSVGDTSQFSERDPVAHRIRRSSVAAAYALNYIATLEPFCDTSTELLLRYLDNAIKTSPDINLSQLMDWYAYDTVSNIAFGTTFGFLEIGADRTGLLRMLGTATHMLGTAAMMSSCGWLIATRIGSWFANILGGGNGPSFLVRYGAKIVKDRHTMRETDRAAYEEKKDMLYRFMESSYSTKFELINAQSRALLRNTLVIIMAGADTTKISMTAFLRYVYSHPTTVQRLRQEMDEAIASGKLSFPIVHSQAARLQFLSACIKEAMRLHPALGVPLQRVVPRGGRVIGHRFYRAGTLVGISPRELHYDPRAYGKDADQWRPERWLEGDRNELEKFSLVFGQGSRVCLGKNVSFMEMSKLLPTIVYYYDIAIKNPEDPWKTHESLFINQYDFFGSVKKREISG